MADAGGSAHSSTIAVTVELPQHARSFAVAVSPGATVRDLKDAIAQECEGRPRADGQRLIAKGKVLADGDLVESVWTGDDAHIVHLAVSPWAWTADPPEAPSPTSPLPSEPSNVDSNGSSSNSSSANVNNNTRAPAMGADLSSQYWRNVEANTSFYEYPDPPSYLMHLHYRALRALSPETPLPARPMEETAEAKEAAISAARQAGMAWPADVFDAEYPPPGGNGEGVTYKVTKIRGLQYLHNLTPRAMPTARQEHALKVLTYTFPLISGIRANDALAGSYFERRLRNIQQRLDVAMRRLNDRGGRAGRAGAGIGFNFGRGGGADALGGGGAPNANGFHAQLQVRIPIRALLLSIVLLAFRVSLLMYFFSPARKPLFSLLVGVWVLYEAWGVVRGAFEEADPLARRAAGAGLGREGDGANGAQGQANAGVGAGAGAGAPNGGDPQQQQAAHLPPQAAPAHAQPPSLTPDYILSRLARLHLAEEEQYLDPRPATNTAEPGWIFKARLFVTLFVLTLHPAFWNRRRVLLTTREAKIRTEAHARASAEEAERDAEQLLQRRREAGAGEGGENGEATPTPTTVDERALQARRAVLQHMSQRDARRPIWVREYVDRVVRDSWADE